MEKTLTESGVEAGTYVIVATASPEATLIAFCGASLIGAVPAIIPIRTAFDGSVAAMDRIAGAQELLGSDARLVIETKNGRPIADAPDGAEPLTIDASAIVPWLAATPPAGFRPSPVSHIQLSSGSTGAGHGIAVSQSNVVANVNGLAERGSLTHYDVVVSWLPMYHDMGLIGHAMSSFILELDAYFMTPFDFLSSPITWLKAISDFRGSVSFSPTFGYELVAKKATLDDVSSLDLSSWKAAACGSEPISADVLERFYETFAASGLNKEAMLPCYGLAEATLAVTGIPAADSWKYITVDTESLAKLDVIEKKDPSIFDSNVSRVVSLGTPVHGVEVSLFDEDGNLIESELQCGEIVVTGVSVGSGYVQSGGTIKAFEGDRVRTGDIGFFDTGELYVVERSKNIVIRNGQNYSSLAIERTVAAATGLEVDDVLVLDRDIIVGSGLTAILCVAKDQDPAALIASVLAKVDQFEPPLEFIACVKRGSMPRTTSGKKQHVAVRDLLNRNAVKFLAYQEVVPTGANVDIEELAVDVASTQGQPADISIEAAREESALLELISGYIHARGLKVAVALTSRLQYDLDIDSLGLLELAMQIEDRFSVVFNREQVAELKTVRDVLALIAQTRGQEHVRTESIRALVQTVRTQIPQHYAVVDDVRENREAFIDGRWVTDLASCNYLGI